MARDQEKRIKGKGLLTAPTVEEMTKAADVYRNMTSTMVFGPKTSRSSRAKNMGNKYKYD